MTVIDMPVINVKKKGKTTLFIHGSCLKLDARGAVYMKYILNKHKSPNWQKVNQLAIYEHDRVVEFVTTVNKSSLWSERELNP